MVRPTGAPPFEIDLRYDPTPGLREALAHAGLRGPFAVITAYNPTGQSPDEETNRQQNERLAERIAERTGERSGERSAERTAARTAARPPAHTPHLIPVDGRSPDGSHVEPGYGVELSLEEACALAREFGQTAIFWWDGTVFWLVEAKEGGECVRLPA